MNSSEDSIIDSSDITEGQIQNLQTVKTKQSSILNSYNSEVLFRNKIENSSTKEQFKIELDESDIQSLLQADQQLQYAITFHQYQLQKDQQECYTETLTEGEIGNYIPSEYDMIDSNKSQQSQNQFETLVDDIQEQERVTNQSKEFLNNDQTKQVKNLQKIKYKENQKEMHIQQSYNAEQLNILQNNQRNSRNPQQQNMQYLPQENKNTQISKVNKNQKMKDTQTEYYPINSNQVHSARLTYDSQFQTPTNSSNKIIVPNTYQKESSPSPETGNSYGTKAMEFQTPKGNYNSSRNTLDRHKSDKQQPEIVGNISPTVQRLMKFHIQKQLKLQQLQNDLKEKELQECSFKPNISALKKQESNAQQKIQKSVNYEDKLQQIMSKQSKYGWFMNTAEQHFMCKGSQKLLDNKIQKPFHQRLHKSKPIQSQNQSPNESQEIMQNFKPKINSRSKSLVRLDKVDQILYKDALRRQEKFKRTESPQPQVYQRSLSPNSLKILKHRVKQDVQQYSEQE